MFVQLKKKNYFANTLVHVVSLIARGPLFSRLLMRQNCSVKVSGRVGYNIALDEFMKLSLFIPLKVMPVVKPQLSVEIKQTILYST